MLRQSVSPQEGASAKAFSRIESLQSYISDCRRIAERPSLAYHMLFDKIKASSSVHVPSSSLSLHAFVDGFLHLIGPRVVSHLLIVVLSAVVATVGGITISGTTPASALRPWEFEPFATRSFSQAKGFLDKPVLPFTDKPVLSFTVTSKRAREGAVTYEVASGDTVTGIAEKFGVSIETVVWANKLDDADSLGTGDKLIILPISGILHAVSDGETVESIASKYQVQPQVIMDSEYNNLSEPYELFIDQKIIVPDGKMPEVKRPMPVARSETRPAESEVSVPAASAPVRGGGQFVWPTAGYISQGFSGYHLGIDIGAAWGTPIYASDNGVVTSAAWAGDYGYSLLIDHGNGYVTRYAHASKFLVSPGQQVTRGQAVALVGSTGRSTGPHLHFEIYQNGARVNPLKFLP